MERLCKIAFAFALLVASMGAPSAQARWMLNGVPVSLLPGADHDLVMTSDGAGGAIIVWEDEQDIGVYYHYAQRVDADGNVLWATNGVLVRRDSMATHNTALETDGAHGVIIVWFERRGGVDGIYAQRIDANGNVLWGAGGVPIRTASSLGFDGGLGLVSDSAGGAFIAWEDRRGADADIYAQRVDANGNALWTAGGVGVCTAVHDQDYPRITSDRPGKAIITWQDYRNGIDWDIYAQKIDVDGDVQWAIDGVPVGTAAGNQTSPLIVKTTTGGAILAWDDSRGGYYAQRINGYGTSLWTANGRPFWSSPNSGLGAPQMIPDGVGGAIMSWTDRRNNPNYDIYAERISITGTVLWQQNGVPVCTESHNQFFSSLASDSTGGAIVVWQDLRAGVTMFAQRVDGGGTCVWSANGIALNPPATGGLLGENPGIIPDGSGGAEIAWTDNRGGTNMDIYAQRIDAEGLWGIPEPHIWAVQDIPADQGSWVRIRAHGSGYDSKEAKATTPITGYNLWRLIPGTALSMEANDGAAAITVETDKLLEMLSSGAVKPGTRLTTAQATLIGLADPPQGEWESIGYHVAILDTGYIFLAPTKNDSTSSGIPWETYALTAHTADPSLFFISNVDSGYSVDNLAPAKLMELAGEQRHAPEGLNLTWNADTDKDLAKYGVYRGLNDSFVPGPSNRLGSPTAASFFDGGWRRSSGYFYKVTAIDRHGNESEAALLRPSDVTGAETPKATYLSQNFPNPFNPATRIAFGLKERGSVSLRIYDASGRLVRMLAEGNRPAANYVETWDGRDASGRAVASGIYFCCLDAGSFTQTRKMIMLR